MKEMNRRQFVSGVTAAVAAGPCGFVRAESLNERLDRWQRETDQVSAETYKEYLRDGDTRGLKTLEHLERTFESVCREVRATTVTDVPAVWSVYNMGYVVKTRASLFSIDLVHRRDCEFAPYLDFALITHNHDDHYRNGFYAAMNRAGKTVVSNFLDNYGVKDWAKSGGFTRAEKTFRLKDVEVRTSLVDHNSYLVDFTTAFEIRVGNWLLYHSGDCGVASKLRTTWGRPDLWTFFPGCGVDVADAVTRIGAKRTAFGHLWELGHRRGRLTSPLIAAARRQAEGVGQKVEVPMWGDRIS